MRLQEYIINESEQTFKKVLSKCSDIVKIYKNSEMYLYRGIDAYAYANKDIIKKKPRKRREPKDTPIEIQKIADSIFYKKFNWKPRSQGVFVTSNYSDALSYGVPYIFLPINGYNFLWSPTVDDLTAYLSSNGILNSLDYRMVLIHDKDRLKRKLEDIIKTYKETNLKQAIKSDNEITFNCSEYYLVDTDYWAEYIEEGD